MKTNLEALLVALTVLAGDLAFAMPVVYFGTLSNAVDMSDAIAIVRIESGPSQVSDGKTVSYFEKYEVDILAVFKGNISTGKTALALSRLDIATDASKKSETNNAIVLHTFTEGALSPNSLHIVFLNRDAPYGPTYRSISSFGNTIPMRPDYSQDDIADLAKAGVEDGVRCVLKDYLDWKTIELKHITERTRLILEGDPDLKKQEPDRVPAER